MDPKRDSSDFWWGALIVLGAVAYRPITFWAENAWDLSAPLRLAPAVLGMTLLGVAVYVLLVSVIRRPYPSAFIAGATILAVFNWTSIKGGLGLALLSVATITTVTLSMRLNRAATRVLVLGTFAITGVLPCLQLGYAHITDRDGYPLLQPASSQVAPNQPQLAGDVLILVVDGYPMRAVAETWFGHETSKLGDFLIRSGFVTPEISWSHNTFTSLALPTMFQLMQVADPASHEEWANLKPNYDISRGDNVVVELARQAGYEYSHVESGWNGDTCGATPTCLHTSWPDEANWQLLSTSVIGDWMNSNWGSRNVNNTFAVADHLTSLPVFGDDTKDIVIAHMMLPHSPFVVDAECRLVPDVDDDREDPSRIAPQLACVDKLLMEIIDNTRRSTVIAIVGDHGTATRGQLSKPPEEWDDADVAERLGAFLAYRLPESCGEPIAPTNAATIHAILSCTTGIVAPEQPPQFVLGLTEPAAVGYARLERIESAIMRGNLNR